MKAQDIINQLAIKLPAITAAFSGTVPVTFMTFSGGLVTVTTTTVHGLATNDRVTVSGALAPNTITTLTRVGNIATATTASPHDLTQGWQSVVEITGAAEPEYNGSKTLLTVPDRNTFTFAVDGTPATPATGTPLLLEDRIGSYNGRHIVTVTSPTTFTYPITFAPGGPAQGSIVLHTQIRVSGAATIERAIDAYTAQLTGALWAFVVLGDVVVSKDRNTLSDMDIELTGAGSNRIKEIENFSVYVFIPCVNSPAGREARDYVDDITPYLYRTIVGMAAPSPLTEPRAVMIVPTGNRLTLYNTAFLVQEFSFQTSRAVTSDDMVIPDENVAMRDVDMGELNSFDVRISTANINLDGDGA